MNNLTFLSILQVDSDATAEMKYLELGLVLDNTMVNTLYVAWFETFFLMQHWKLSQSPVQFWLIQGLLNFHQFLICVCLKSDICSIFIIVKQHIRQY